MSQERPSCASCHWWLKFPGIGTKTGECHRYPPTHSQRDPTTIPQPTTKETDWCGEHKACEVPVVADKKQRVSAYMADAATKKVTAK